MKKGISDQDAKLIINRKPTLCTEWSAWMDPWDGVKGPLPTNIPQKSGNFFGDLEGKRVDIFSGALQIKAEEKEEIFRKLYR